jgi:hypothetical protein
MERALPGDDPHIASPVRLENAGQGRKLTTDFEPRLHGFEERG